MRFPGGQIQKDKVVIPLPVFGKSRLECGMIEKGGKAECEIRIRVPEDTYKKAGIFEFAMRQLLVGSDGKEENEVGRLTWQFGQGQRDAAVRRSTVQVIVEGDAVEMG